jgi:hypothetical protein
MLEKLNIGKKAFVVWLLWFFICISFWIIPGAKLKVEFFLFSGSFPSSLLNHYAWYYWDYQETFVFGIGPMILYVFVKTLFGTKN